MVEDLRRRALHGVAWTSAQRWLVRLSTLGGFIVVGRLLSPAEIGTATAALAVVALTSIFTDAGVSNFLISQQLSTREALNTAFAITVGLGILLTAALYFGASVLVPDEPHGGNIALLQVAAFAVLLSSIGVVPAAVMQMALDFKGLAVRQVIATFVSIVVLIVMTVAGAGAWALIGQAVARTAIATGVLFVRGSYRGGIFVDRSLLAPMLGFGIRSWLDQGFSQGRESTENLLIGHLGGSELLGIWSIANRLISTCQDLLSSSVVSVVYSLSARLAADQVRLTRLVRVVLTAGSVACCFAFAALSWLLPSLVPMLFGNQWEFAGILASILAIRGAFVAFGEFERGLLLGVGRINQELAMSSLALAGNLVGVYFFTSAGLEATAFAISVAAAFTLMCRSALVSRLLDRRRGLPVQCSLLLLLTGTATALLAFDPADFPGGLRGMLLAAAALMGGATGIALLLRGDLLQVVRSVIVRRAAE